MAIEHHDRANFDEYVAELAGSSRDRAIRPAIDHLVRQFLQATDENRPDVDIVMSFFSDNPTVIRHLSRPGYIWIGAVEVKQFFEDWKEQYQQTIPKIIIVDRGRVACHAVNFYFQDMRENPDEFTEHHQVIVMDLDKSNRIERLEYRATTRKDKIYKGGPRLYDALVKEVKEDAIAVDYSS